MFSGPPLEKGTPFSPSPGEFRRPKRARVRRLRISHHRPLLPSEWHSCAAPRGSRRAPSAEVYTSCPPSPSGGRPSSMSVSPKPLTRPVFGTLHLGPRNVHVNRSLPVREICVSGTRISLSSALSYPLCPDRFGGVDVKSGEKPRRTTPPLSYLQGRNQKIDNYSPSDDFKRSRHRRNRYFTPSLLGGVPMCRRQSYLPYYKRWTLHFVWVNPSRPTTKKFVPTWCLRYSC